MHGLIYLYIMAALIFLVTVITLFVFSIGVIIKLIKRKPVRRYLQIISGITGSYFVIWLIFAMSQKCVIVPMDTEICFDDWCATITGARRVMAVDSLEIRLHVQMSNHARGIAQTPSEPRGYILDNSGHEWAYSPYGQTLYNKQFGPQPGIGHRLLLGETLETVIVFRLPRSIKGLRAVIREGPWITNLLFPQDEQVFAL